MSCLSANRCQCCGDSGSTWWRTGRLCTTQLRPISCVPSQASTTGHAWRMRSMGVVAGCRGRGKRLAAIETYSTVVLHVDSETLGALRRLSRPENVGPTNPGAAMPQATVSAGSQASDVLTLLALNDDYIGPSA